MKKVTMVLTACLLAATSTAVDAAPASKALKEAMQKHVLTARPAGLKQGFMADRNSCEDFSGRWAGSCKVAGEEERVEMSVEQTGCNSISFDGDNLEFGQTRTDISSSDQFFSNAVWAGNLSESGQEVRVFGTMLINSKQFPAPISGAGAGTLKKEGERLVGEGTIKVRAGLKELAQVDVSCAFHKID